MIIKEDICPKTGLKREIEFIKFIDNKLNKTILLDCNLNYYNKDTNEFIATNILNKDAVFITLDNNNNLDGIGEYDYWKGMLNDFNALKEKGIHSFDGFSAYIIMKAYLAGKFN